MAFTCYTPRSLATDHLSQTIEERISLVCLATAGDQQSEHTFNPASHELSHIAEQDLMTLSPKQVLLIIRGSRPALSELVQKLASTDTPVTASLSALMDSLSDIKRECYLSSAENRAAIGHLIETEALPQSDDNLIFTDSELTAIYLDKENAIAISNTDQLDAMLGLQQLGFDKSSTNLWFGTSHSEEALSRMDREAFASYLHSLDATIPCSNDSHATLRCGSSGKKVDRTEGVHLSYEDPHHEATEAILWTSVAVTILLAVLLPLAIFL